MEKYYEDTINDLVYMYGLNVDCIDEDGYTFITGFINEDQIEDFICDIEGQGLNAVQCDDADDWCVAVFADENQDDAVAFVASPRHYFGGNSGYVNYSKSKRAVQAEEDGLRNKSQIDKTFADEVNDIIQQVTPGAPTVTLSQIKKALPQIDADEWHHTSMYGNKTNYYSAKTIAEFFVGEDIPEPINQDREEYFNIKKELDENIINALNLEAIEVPGYYGNTLFFRASNDVLLEYDGAPTEMLGETAYIVHENGMRLIRPYSKEWRYYYYDINKAQQEYEEAKRQAIDELPQKLVKRFEELENRF